MGLLGTFPFGQQVERVVQIVRGPKRVFILGVYASAVYARWLAEDDSTLVNAVPVASEPEVFWRGDGSADIVASIPVPPGAGRLVGADEHLNGASGAALDELFLAPLGLTRPDAWLCDLVPYSCRNDKQAAAIVRAYDPRITEFDLPAFDWPTLPKVLADPTRRAEIAAELTEASPDLLITLGDQPLRWFTSHFGSKGRLASYGESKQEYGRVHELRLGRRTMMLMPLAHPRQVARLGSYSAEWGGLHEYWASRVAPNVLLDTNPS